MFVFVSNTQPAASAPAQTVQTTWWSGFDPTYLTSRPGLLKIACIVVSLVVICIPAYWYNHVAGHLGIWFTSFVLWCYVWRIVERHPTFQWLKIEGLVCLVLAALFLICSSIVVRKETASAVFGYIAMLLYALEAGLKYKAVLDGEVAQAPRPVIYTAPA